METVKKKVDAYSFNHTIYVMGLFDWHLIKEEKFANYSVIHFQRDDTTPYYQEMVDIEKETEIKTIPLFVFIILIALSFGLLTVYLILFLINRDSFNTKLFFLSLFVPAIVSLSTATLLFYFRNKQQMDFLKSEKERLEGVEKRLESLKQKYKNK